MLKASYSPKRGDLLAYYGSVRARKNFKYLLVVSVQTRGVTEGEVYTVVRTIDSASLEIRSFWSDGKAGTFHQLRDELIFIGGISNDS